MTDLSSDASAAGALSLGRLGGSRARVAVGGVDQVLSSLSNVLVLVAIARTASVEEFGVVSLAMATLTTAMAIGRGVFGTPITLLAGGGPALRRETRFALAAATLLGLAAALLLAMVNAIMGGPNAVYAVAAACPVVLLQDSARFHCMAMGAPERAVLSDGVWALGVGALLFVPAWWAAGSSAVLVAGWGALGAVAAAILVVPLRLTPKLRGLLGWWRASMGDRFRYGAEATIAATSSLAVLGVAAWLVGEEATAALRGAGTALGPLGVLMTVIPLAVVPELRRRRTVSPVRLWRALRRLAIALSCLAVVVGLAALLVPSSWGTWVLGDSWRVSQPLIPILAVEYAGLAWISAVGGSLRAQGRSDALLQLRVILSVVGFVGAVVAAAVFQDARAVATALAAAAIISAIWGRKVALSALRGSW